MQEFLMRPMSILPCSRRLTFIRAENCHLFDTEGKTYLDAFAANGDIVAGHAEPLIRDAYANPSEDSSTRLLKELTRLLPGYLSTFQLFKSGVQAVREACEISRRYRNKSHIIGISEDATQNNFLILASSEGDSFTPLFSIDTNFELISHAGTNPPVIGHKKLSAINTSPRGACLSSFENFFSELTDQTAAIVIEPSAGVGGAIESCRKFFGMLEEFCLANGIDLISNETQCGLGRTGSRLFGFQLLNIHPNIVCIGPSLANGYPIGVSVYGEHFSDLVEPVIASACSSCSAALATLKIISESNLLRRSEQLGDFFKAQLLTKIGGHRLVKQIRGLGLMLEIEFENEEAALNVHHLSSELGLITGTGNMRHNILRLTPPLVFTSDMVETACQILADALKG